MKWHHRITHYPMASIEEHVWSGDEYENICPYLRMFFWKLLVVIPITVLCIGAFLGWYLAGLAYFLTTLDMTFSAGQGYEVWLLIHVALISVTVGFLLYNACSLLVNYLYSKKQKEREDPDYVKPPQGILSMWWDKVLHKICKKMKY